MAVTRHNVIVHQADRLHESVADGRADEFESALDQVFTQRVRFGGLGRNLLQRLAGVLSGLAADELPDVGVKAAELLLNGQERLRVLNRRCHLEPVAHNAGIRQQLGYLAFVVAGHHARVKVVERTAIIFALFQACYSISSAS